MISSGIGRNNNDRHGVNDSVSLGPAFPVTTWFWRRLRSRGACRLYLFGFTLVVISGIALRIEAALFERRALSIVTALSSLEVGTTSKAETLSRIPTLKDESALYGLPSGGSDELFSAGIPNSGLSDAVLLRAARTENKPLYSVLSWWGFRYWGLSVYVNFSSNKVSSVRYHLMVSTSKLGVGDAVVVGVACKQDITRPNSRGAAGESSNYRIITSRIEPSQGVGIDFTPDAPRELASNAFDLRLKCLWSLSGCRTWNQLLPSVRRAPM